MADLASGAEDAAPPPHALPTIRLADYRPPAFRVPAIELDVAIEDDHAIVRAHMRFERADPTAAALALDGDELVLVSVALDGRALGLDEYTATPERLTVPNVPDRFTLEVVTRIDPAANTKLMGLYRSKDGLFTQCEAEGFRRITYALDRPDVMARYTTTLHADRERYPVLLSNGNPVAAGAEPGNPARHWVRWEDPFPKPAYLFAMVAAKLDKIERRTTTRSGRPVLLAVYVEPGKLDQAGFALDALEKSMRWDEQVFGLELDLDQYMIVAVGDFNMGAMENKGLNIFNTKYVLARPDTATDGDYENIDRVVAHEYFHNWTGNRVTCRDWFQLSLKEGLTVFRDQEFGADMYSRPVQRIQEVRRLRAAQFPEDAGPMAHPVRPSAYIEISNFYTATVYEKGAEVVRMIHTLIGARDFRRGMDLYFRRHDGQAVTTEDFVAAMADAAGVDLTQFRRWYDQAGTPVVEVADRYDPDARSYLVTFRQWCPPTPGQPTKLPFHIPIAFGLVGPDGADIALQLDGEPADPGNTRGSTTRVLSIRREAETVRFVNVPVAPVPSIARGFSAPVAIRYAYAEDQLTHLMAHDSDPFNRWEAGQRLALAILLRGVESALQGKPVEAPPAFIDALDRVLEGAAADPAFAAEALTLPSEGYISEQLEVADPDAIHAARLGLRRVIAAALRDRLLATYRAGKVAGPYSPDARSAGARALRNACLGYLMELADPEVRALCRAQFDGADNMTDAMAALGAFANADVPERRPVLEHFYERWRDEALVLDKWLTVQATSRLPGTLAEVRRLMSHPAYDARNPNKVRALVSSFCHGNAVHFHAADGSGYRFCAEQVRELDALNPQVAARLARAFDRWRKLDSGRQAHARAALESIRAAGGLSKDVFEVVSRALA